MASSSNIKAGAAYIELYTKDSRLVKGLNDAAKQLDAFGKSLQGIGTKMAMLGAGIVTPLAGAAKVFADMGSDMVDMSQRTGVSVEALSELGFAAEQSGADTLSTNAAAIASCDCRCSTPSIRTSRSSTSMATRSASTWGGDDLVPITRCQAPALVGTSTRSSSLTSEVRSSSSIVAKTNGGSEEIGSWTPWLTKNSAFSSCAIWPVNGVATCGRTRTQPPWKPKQLNN